MTVTTTCPNCGAENSVEGQFCMRCGAQFKTAQDSAAARLEPTASVSIQPPPAIAMQPPPNTPAPPPAAPMPMRPLEEPAAQPWAGTTSQVPLTQLGTLVDSWSDLLDDLGDKSAVLTTTFQTRMAARRIPNTRFTASELTPGGLSNQRRLYQLARTKTGATVAVRIDQFGQDLFMSWDLWVRPLPNWSVILSMLGLAAFFALSTARPPALFGPSQISPILWIIGTIGHSLWIGFLVGLAGKVVRGSWTGFFFKQLTPFDVDDITAMSLAVHHSLLEAADTVGISTKLLRPKETFRGGQRERVI